MPFLSRFDTRLILPKEDEDFPVKPTYKELVASDSSPLQRNVAQISFYIIRDGD